MAKAGGKGGAEFGTVYNCICYITECIAHRHTTHWAPAVFLCIVDLPLPRGPGHMEPIDPSGPGSTESQDSCLIRVNRVLQTKVMMGVLTPSATERALIRRLSLYKDKLK